MVFEPHSYSVSVNTCLKMCGLEAYANASVGSLGIEHRKRTTIAVELAAKVNPRTLGSEPWFDLGMFSPSYYSSWMNQHRASTLNPLGL